MTQETPKELLENGFITEDQFAKIDLITSGKVVSVFYELRTLLYLGVMLFTTGVGILIYQNIGELGHMIAVTALMLLTAGCFWYVFRHAPPYSNRATQSPTPYFDYIVLLSALLFISVLGYLQFLYEIFELRPGLVTLVTAAFFFYVAYRFDHVGVLSLAIAALASFWSISISPQKWYSGNFFSAENLHITAIIFSITLGAIALALDWKTVKQHFTFTYLNFCSLIFFVGVVVGLFMGEWYGVYLLLIVAGCVFAYYMARWKQSFLFLLYAFLAAYIGFTYLLAEVIEIDDIGLWFFYSILSCGAFIYFIVKYKNYFKSK